jgi:hypothetical protein
MLKIYEGINYLFTITTEKAKASMFSNYIKTAYRSILRNKGYFLISIAGLALGLAIFTACVSNPSKAREIETLLPSSAEISPWRKNGPPAIFLKDRLFEYINGGAEIYFEYGFHQAVTQEYVRGDNSIIVEIYEMNDSDAAFGIYSIQRDYKLPALKIGSAGTQFDNHAAFWQDRYVVVVLASIPGTASKEALNQLAQNISLRIGKTSQPPKLVEHLPQKNIVTGSQGFINGILGLNSQYYLAQENVLGLGNENVQGAFAIYRINSEEARLLIVQYDSVEKSKIKEAVVQKIFSGKYKSDEDDPFIYKDKKGRFYAAKSGSNFLCVIYRSDSKSLINEILKQGITPSN